MNDLMIKVAEQNEVMNYKVVRSAMDKSLNTMLDNTDIKIIYEIFGEKLRKSELILGSNWGQSPESVEDQSSTMTHGSLVIRGCFFSGGKL